MYPANISVAFATVQKKSKAAAEAGRKEQNVTLIAVSKKQQDDRIDASLKTGHRIYGENRVRKQNPLDRAESSLPRFTPSSDRSVAIK